jgi:RNA polymerase sigma-70 factor, ECF subfamily
MLITVEGGTYSGKFDMVGDGKFATHADFESAIVSLLPNLRRYALSLCRSPQTADDLVQSTCERAFAAKLSFQPGTRIDAWLFRILRNLWIDTIRKSRFEMEPLDGDAAPDIPDQTAEAAAETKLLLKQVSDIVMRLPDAQREVVLLVCVEEMSYKEASELLEVPIGTVMSRLARARREIMRVSGIK